jgi:hypothetical protein
MDSVDMYFLNIPFSGIDTQNFLLVQTDKWGSIRNGRLICLKKEEQRAGEGHFFYNGSITIRSFKNELLVQSAITNGSITALHPKRRVLDSRLSLVQPAQPAGEMLPEVIVIGYREPSGGVSYSDWISLQGMFGGGGSGGSSGYYGPVASSGGAAGGSYGGGSGYSSGGSGSTLYRVPPLQVDFENQDANPAIEIQKYLNCFASIPDAGASCSIEILTDIPVDKDPNKLFNWKTESPGHTFLQIKKVNGTKSIVQNIGYYPKTNWKTVLTPAPVAGKFVDNGGHEFNASLRMAITPAQLNEALTHILYLARFIKYDIDEYNCTDFALEVFNVVRNPAKKLIIPKYDIPGGAAPYGTNTPQGLYNKLKSMQQTRSAETNNLSIAGYKSWVANSNGPCN